MTTEHELLRKTATAGHYPWNEDVAQRIAAEHGIKELTPDHWCVIHTLREHYIQYGAVPPMRVACDLNRLDPHCADWLFHSPQEAWEIAGLSAPVEEAESYAYPGDMVQY